MLLSSCFSSLPSSEDMIVYWDAAGNKLQACNYKQPGCIGKIAFRFYLLFYVLYECLLSTLCNIGAVINLTLFNLINTCTMII